MTELEKEMRIVAMEKSGVAEAIRRLVGRAWVINNLHDPGPYLAEEEQILSELDTLEQTDPAAKEIIRRAKERCRPW